MLYTGSQPYELQAQPTVWPVTVAEVKDWLKIPASSTLQDSNIDLIIRGVTSEAEKYTKRDFITKSYKTYRDVFGDVLETPVSVASSNAITLRKSPLVAVTSINYYIDDVLTLLDSADYRVVKKSSFSQVSPINGWPSSDDRQQAVEVFFTAGYGAAESDMPDDIRLAMLAHVAAVYSSRGDCDTGGSCSCKFAPAESMAVYNQYRILDFRAL